MAKKLCTTLIIIIAIIAAVVVTIAIVAAVVVTIAPAEGDEDDGAEMTVVSSYEKIDFDLSADYEDLTEDDLRQMNDGDVDIYYLSTESTVRSIEGTFSSQIVTNEQEALAALMSVRSLMGIESYDYCCVSADTGNNTVYTLAQLYEGVRVDNGFFRVTVSETGETVSVSGEYAAVDAVDTTPKLTASECAANISLSQGQEIVSAEAVILESERTLCWKYTIYDTSNRANDCAVYLSASTGETVKTIALAQT